jgi:putative redox protein
LDVIAMLRKMREDVTQYDVVVTGPRAETHPRIFESLYVLHVVRGRNLSVQNVRRAVELSATKYCPVSAMLSRAIPVRHQYEIFDADGTAIDSGSIDVAVSQ